MRESVSSANGARSVEEEVALAQAELRSLIHSLADEISSFRQRALAAEARQRELEHVLSIVDPAVTPVATSTEPVIGVTNVVGLAARVAELEVENAGLRERLAMAAERTRRLLDRARFLRQQQAQGEEVG